MESEKIGDRIRDCFDNYELFLLKEKTKKYESRDKELYGVELKEEEGIALRGIKGNRMVFSYTYDKGDKGIAALLENTKMLMSFAEDDKDIDFPERYDNYPFLELYDYKGLAVDDMQKTSLLLKMEKTILDYDRRIVTTRNCGLQETEIQTEIIKSLTEE